MRFGSDFFKNLTVPLFYDPKFFDIPATVLSSIKAAFDCGFQYVTIHAANGPECLKLIAELESELNQIRSFKILVVTVLTSFDRDNLPSHWQKKEPNELVALLIKDVYTAGLRNIVCSAHEVKFLKKMYPDLFCVTPGIRFEGRPLSDQKRVMTPKSALEAGADALVIGRPVLLAKNPKDACLRVIKEVESVKKP
jgi:orotidine-5'-phosphate decarboxylase